MHSQVDTIWTTKIWNRYRMKWRVQDLIRMRVNLPRSLWNFHLERQISTEEIKHSRWLMTPIDTQSFQTKSLHFSSQAVRSTNRHLKRSWLRKVAKRNPRWNILILSIKAKTMKLMTNRHSSWMCPIITQHLASFPMIYQISLIPEMLAGGEPWELQ